MRITTFDKEEKMKLVDILNHSVYINERSEYVNNAVKIYCKSVFDALGDKDVSMIKFYSL